MNLKNIKIDIVFKYWLSISLFFVFLIIIVGGLTRLTNSGLSIIEWELFKGILPPLNEAKWNLYFEKYKTIPQYKLLNFNMSLDEFKFIFYWEYFHRLLARVIGLFFLIPLIFFYFSNKIKRKYLNTCLIIFCLIVFQGFMGWYMVESGLIHDVTVSHYRLSVHLVMAFIIGSSIFWLIKNTENKNYKNFFKFTKNNFPYYLLFIIIFFQVILGAFVSGLDAGMVYQTWPMMGDSFVPNDLKINNLNALIDFDNLSLVQFYHRNLAYFIILYVLLLTIIIFKKKHRHLFRSIKILLIIIFLQVFLGVATLLSGINLYIASAHQITSVLLVFSAINLYYFSVK